VNRSPVPRGEKGSPTENLSSSSLQLNMIPPAIEQLGSYKNMTCCPHPCFQKDRSLAHRRAISAVVKRVEVQQSIDRRRKKRVRVCSDSSHKSVSG
jgi:hypothetical protein